MCRMFTDRSHLASLRCQTFRNKFKTLVGVTFACVSGTVFAAYPAVIDVANDTDELRSDAHITVDGERVRSRSMGDLDADGLGDRIIEIRATDAEACPGVAIWLSTQNSGFVFSRSELDALVRITDEAIPDNSGGVDCRNRNLRGFSEPRRLGDINGDGLTDLLVNVSGTSNNARIVFGTTVGGARIDIDALDGSNGFTVTGIAREVFPVGDVNGDGFDDIGHSSSFNPLSGVFAGRASFNATLDVSDSPNQQSLVGPMNLSRLRGLGDIDGDGHADLVAYPNDSDVAVENQIPRFFYGAANLSVRTINEPNQRIIRMMPECGPRQCQFYPVGDIDNDGRDDILASQRFQSINIPPRSILYGREGGLVPRNEINDYPEGERTQLVRGNVGTINDRGDFYRGSFNRSYRNATGQRFDLDGDGTEDLVLEAFFTTQRQGLYILFGLPGQRPAVRSLDETDGFLGVTFDLGGVVTANSSLSTPELGDVNLDGIDDYFWNDGPEVPYVPGRSRNLDGLDVLGLGVRRSPEQLALFWNDVVGASTYRIEFDDRFIEEVANDTTKRTLSDDTDGASLVVTVKAIDTNGLTISTQIRRVPEFVPIIDRYSADVYGPELLELFIEPNTDRFDRELIQNLVVVRDEEIIGQTQGTSYLDRTVTQGGTFRYQLFSNVLIGSNFNNTTLDMGPRIQFATGIVTAETPVDPNAVDPDDSDTTQSDNPEPAQNLRVERYSAFDVEVFWNRADEEGLLYEFFRDGELIRTLSGISVYDTRRPENSGATYEVIALRRDGTRSEPRSVVLQPVLNGDNDNTGNNGGNNGGITDPNTDPNATEAPGNLRVVRYSIKDAELFWERAADPLLQYEVKRDGVVQRAPFFGISFFDRLLEPNDGAVYEVTAIAANGARSTTSTITLAGENAIDATPAPENLRAEVYSITAAELFWARASAEVRVVRTEVTRDGDLIGSTPGNSFFDDTRIAGAAHIYVLVAIDALGNRSTPTILQVAN